MKVLALLLLPLLVGSCRANAQSFDPRDPHSPLKLVRTIELPKVRGRIDHMALDEKRNHLFVAEYGNGTLDDIDLALGRVVGTIAGLHEPQGVAWLAKQQEIAVASGDGLVSFYRGGDLQKTAIVQLGDDADNVRVDPRNGDLIVGYGSGALAVIDPAMHKVVRQIRLPAHPEGFVLLGDKLFVNLPDAREIVVGDLDQGRVTTKLTTGPLLGNYPMASDATGSRIAIAYRLPGAVSVLDAASGAVAYSLPVCRDADDLYFLAGRVIVVCGEGSVELLGETARQASVRIDTRRGARTGLLDPEHNRLFVAVPSGQGTAAIWELSFR